LIVWLIIQGIVAVGVGIVAGTGMYESRIDKDVANTAIYSIRSLIGSTLRISLYLPTKFYHTWSDTVVECASGPFDRFLAPVTTIEYVLCGVKGSTWDCNRRLPCKKKSATPPGVSCGAGRPESGRERTEAARLRRNFEKYASHCEVRAPSPGSRAESLIVKSQPRSGASMAKKCRLRRWQTRAGERDRLIEPGI